MPVIKRCIICEEDFQARNISQKTCCPKHSAELRCLRMVVYNKNYYLANRDRCISRVGQYHKVNFEKHRTHALAFYYRHKKKILESRKRRDERIRDLLSILGAEMPELIKEFGL